MSRPCPNTVWFVIELDSSSNCAWSSVFFIRSISIDLSFCAIVASRSSAFASVTCTLPSPTFWAVSIVVVASVLLSLSLTILISELTLSSLVSFLFSPRIVATVTTKSAKYAAYKIAITTHSQVAGICDAWFSTYFWKTFTTITIASPQISENSRQIYPWKFSGLSE